MSITDELRKWGRATLMPPLLVKMEAIADRIDAEHESACAEAYGNGVMSVPIALDESAWVELPKDADGEYIHIGDVMEDADGEVFTVSSIDYGFHSSANRGAAAWMLWSIDAEFDEPANECRHHHAPTVEDVLREFALKAAGRECMTMRSDLVDEYASKLQLREDA